MAVEALRQDPRCLTIRVPISRNTSSLNSFFFQAANCISHCSHAASSNIICSATQTGRSGVGGILCMGRVQALIGLLSAEGKMRNESLHQVQVNRYRPGVISELASCLTPGSRVAAEPFKTMGQSSSGLR